MTVGGVRGLDGATVTLVTVPCAQLRAFLPLEALDEADRIRWSPPSSQALGRRAAAQREERLGRARLLGGRAALGEPVVLTRRVGDERYVCPLQLDVRLALALRELRGELTDPMVERLVPDEGLRRRLAGIAAAGRRPTVVDAPWSVPLTWFALFDDAERRFRDAPEGDGPSLTYLTTVERAMPRLDRAIEAVDGAVEDAEVLLDELVELADWVDALPSRSLLELDYAGLARTIERDDLVVDRSSRDVWRAVEGLESGDLLAAVAYHGAIESRWGPRRARAHAS